VKLLVEKDKCRTGLDFVHQELFDWMVGSLWFAIAVISCHQRRDEGSLQEGGELILIKEDFLVLFTFSKQSVLQTERARCFEKGVS